MPRSWSPTWNSSIAMTPTYSSRSMTARACDSACRLEVGRQDRARARPTSGGSPRDDGSRRADRTTTEPSRPRTPRIESSRSNATSRSRIDGTSPIARHASSASTGVVDHRLPLAVVAQPARLQHRRRPHPFHRRAELLRRRHRFVRRRSAGRRRRRAPSPAPGPARSRAPRPAGTRAPAPSGTAPRPTGTFSNSYVTTSAPSARRASASRSS